MLLILYNITKPRHYPGKPVCQEIRRHDRDKSFRTAPLLQRCARYFTGTRSRADGDEPETYRKTGNTVDDGGCNGSI